MTLAAQLRGRRSHDLRRLLYRGLVAGKAFQGPTNVSKDTLKLDKGAMTSLQTQLRTSQQPLKQQYRKDPSSAQVTLRTHGTLDATSVTCSLTGPNADEVRSARAKVAGLHPLAGGAGSAHGELCSGDMLLEALVACSGVTLKAVATALQIPLETGMVRAEGDLDFRGTLGIDQNAPVGFTAIRLYFDLKMQQGKEVAEADIDMLGQLTEKYCVVLQTIAQKPELVVRVDSVSEAEEGVEKTHRWRHEDY